MLSKTMQQILEVLKELKKNVVKEASSAGGISIGDAERLTKDCYEKVAKRMRVTRSTVADKCTRQLELKSEDFSRLALEYLTNQNDDLEKIIIGNLKPSLDDEIQLRKELRAVK